MGGGHDHLAAQAVQLDSHLAEYVPNDILSTAEGISYDLDVNELMVRLPCNVSVHFQLDQLA